MYTVKRQRRKIELLEQKIGEVFRTTRRHLEPHRLTVMALLQTLTQGGAQVFNVLLIHRQIRMPRDAELRKLIQLPTREKLGQMSANHA